MIRRHPKFMAFGGQAFARLELGFFHVNQSDMLALLPWPFQRYNGRSFGYHFRSAVHSVNVAIAAFGPSIHLRGMGR